MRAETLYHNIQSLLLDFVRKPETKSFIYNDNYAISMDTQKLDEAVKIFMAVVLQSLAMSYKNSHEWEFENGKKAILELVEDMFNDWREKTREEVK